MVTQNGFTVLLCCGTALPARFTEFFSTRDDGQVVLPIELRKRKPGTDDAQPLGTFVIDGIKLAPAGSPEVEVTIVVDSSGEVKAFAAEAASGLRKEAHLGRVGVTGMKDDN